MAVNTVLARERRRARVRKKVSGTVERPRVSIFRSLKYIYAQLIDDAAGNTLASASSIEKEFTGQTGGKGNKNAAHEVGKLLAGRAAGKGIKKAVFDRSGYRYHGCVKEVAEGAREGGLEF